jgi:hypothetical protein
MTPIRVLSVIAVTLLIPAVHAQDLHIPASTAYLDPNPNAARVTRTGITNWSTEDTILWGGILTKGPLTASLSATLPKGESSRLKLTIAAQSHEADLQGTGEAQTLDFGSFDVPDTKYQRIELTSVRKSTKTFADVQDLILSGPATKDAFFNLKPRRNAASVHLNYPLPKGMEVAWFYNELTPKLDPPATYYQACGFARGYFGIQVISATERHIIFSVWDAGNEAVDRSKVADENRVKLLAKGEGVVARDFGNEGTGGHSHLVYPWKTNTTQRFLVTAKADGPEATIYSGYYFFADRGERWGLIACFRAPRDGKLLRGLYSFVEDFNGNTGHLRRLCEFGNQWIKTPADQWIELTTAGFTHDGTGGRDRRDFGAGVTPEHRFYLSNGGFIAEPIKYGDKFTRPAGDKPPKYIDLP